MRNSLALLIFLLLVLSGFSMSNGEETTLKDSVSIKGRITGELKGIVVDEKGDPVKGAIVAIDGTHWTCTTNESGAYNINGIKAATYSVTATDSNKTISINKDIRIDVGLTVTENFKLVPKECEAEEQKPRTIDLENIEELAKTKPEDILKKPIIYLYPEKETEVNVKLNYKGTFTATYPKYPDNGWTVTAKPDGTLTDKNGKKYYSLFWEGVTDKTFTVNEGFVINKEDAADFLEKSLTLLGLNYKEANEFIIYWLPELEKHPYNLIHFSTKEYEELAELTVDPKPDTIIRVFMVFKGLDKPVEIKEQKLVSKSRKGFTVVEWGGSEIKGGTSRIK